VLLRGGSVTSSSARSALHAVDLVADRRKTTRLAPRAAGTIWYYAVQPDVASARDDVREHVRRVALARDDAGELEVPRPCAV
jgi:hypothetical protein